MPLTFDIFLKQVKRYFILFNEEITFIGLILGLFGWIFFYKKDKLFAMLNFILFIISGIGFLLIANLPFDSLSDGIIERFFILPTLPFCISIGFGIDYIYKRSKILAVLLGLVSIAFLFSGNFNHTNWRNYYLVYDYGKNILKTLKPNSILFMDGGDDTFYSTAYLCFAEGRRKDIELHDRGGLVFKNIYGNDFRSLSKEEKENRRKKIELEIVKKGKPVFYSTFNKNILPDVSLYENGILYEVNKKTHNSWYLYSLLRGAFNTYSDYRSRALAPVYVFMRARTLENPEQKEKWWNYAIYQWKDVIWLVSNLKFELHAIAYKMFNENKMNFTEKYYKKILEIDPYDIDTLLNLGVVYEKTKRFTLAESCYKKIMEVKPDYAKVYYNMAVLEWQKQNWPEVVKMFRKFLDFEPDNLKVKKYLLIAEEKLKK